MNTTAVPLHGRFVPNYRTRVRPHSSGPNTAHIAESAAQDGSSRVSAVPSSRSSIRISWLYLARRSDRTASRF